MTSTLKNPIFCALDTTDLERARALVKAVSAHVGGFKIGTEFFGAYGPDGVCDVVGDAAFFLDLKFHDIPNTVAGAVRAGCALRPTMMDVHAAGGLAMMAAARDAAAEESEKLGVTRPWIIAVTVLTSLDQANLDSIGVQGKVEDQVLRLAALAKKAGLDGIVCSPQEIGRIRNELGPDFKLVVPGVRPSGTATGDQKRTMTPPDAFDLGADVLVIGRPITAAPDSAAAAKAIAESLNARAA